MSTISSMLFHSEAGSVFGFHGTSLNSAYYLSSPELMNVWTVVGYCPVISIISGLVRAVMYSVALIDELVVRKPDSDTDSDTEKTTFSYAHTITQVFRGICEALQLGLVFLLILDIIFTVGRLLTTVPKVDNRVM